MPNPFVRGGRATAVVLALTLAAACGPAATTTPTATADPMSPAPSASPTAASSPSATAPAESGSPLTASPSPSDAAFDPDGVTVSLEAVTDIPGAPLAVTHAGDGSGRLFVAERGGRIWIVRDGQRLEQPFLDIATRVTAEGESGLLGLAFHPDYPEDPRFFIYYTDTERDQVVAERRVSAEDPDRADPSAERELLRMDDFAANHNGGGLAFGPDGRLYIATGDGGGAGDPQGTGQRLDTLLGKILRIGVDPTSDGAYEVPDDNPFVGRDEARPEIWHLGLRNPWRFSFDRQTGDLWIGDVGQGQWEEIDVARDGVGGLNFGWSRTEGNHCFREGCSMEGLTAPVTEYSHDFGCSVTGGVVYRGDASPALRGAYLYADYCSGLMWALNAASGIPPDPAIVAETGRSISSFGKDEAGEVYVTDLGGSLLRVVGQER